MEDTLKAMFGALLEVADKERKSSEPYKDMFKRTDGKPFCVQLQQVEGDLMHIVLNYTQILKEHGYEVSNETFRFLLALPILAHILEKDIVKKEGSVCSVDKVYTLLHKELKRLLSEVKLRYTAGEYILAGDYATIGKDGKIYRSRQSYQGQMPDMQVTRGLKEGDVYEHTQAKDTI